MRSTLLGAGSEDVQSRGERVGTTGEGPRLFPGRLERVPGCALQVVRAWDPALRQVRPLRTLTALGGFTAPWRGAGFMGFATCTAGNVVASRGMSAVRGRGWRAGIALGNGGHASWGHANTRLQALAVAHHWLNLQLGQDLACSSGRWQRSQKPWVV